VPDVPTGPDRGEIVGTVAGVQVFPVRSTAGQQRPSADVTVTGLVGDRAWVVVGEDGAALRAKDAPGLAGVATTGLPDVDTALVSAALGRPLALAPATPGPGVAPVHLVGSRAVRRAAAGEVPEGCSADDPRANLLLEVDADERSWVGRVLEVGSAVLQVTRTPKHCLGVYADVLVPGRVAVGDPVRLREAGPPAGGRSADPPDAAH
jgi:uncharacterized protein